MPKRKDDLEGMNLVPKAAARAVKALGEAFYWKATAEGDDYWRTVYNRLEALSRTE